MQLVIIVERRYCRNLRLSQCVCRRLKPLQGAPVVVMVLRLLTVIVLVRGRCDE